MVDREGDFAGPRVPWRHLSLAVRTIQTSDKPVLRIKAKPVQRVDNGVRKLLDDMMETMHDSYGAGLAAPQVGESVRAIVLVYEEAEFKLVNPEITWTSHERETDEEGCLSIPGYRGLVSRPKAIRVRAKDRSGHPVHIRADGRLARIFQHEIDHLDGVLFTDRMAPGELLWRVVEPGEEEETLLLTGTDSR
jgi:peptide deformylase